MLALALPVFVAAGWPVVGWAACAGAWIVQRALHGLMLRRIAGGKDPKAAVGVLGASMMIRLWLVAGVILVVGLTTSKEAGLAAAILAAVLFQASLLSLFLDRTAR